MPGRYPPIHGFLFDLSRPIGVTWLKQRPLPPAAQRLVAFLKQEIRALG